MRSKKSFEDKGYVSIGLVRNAFGVRGQLSVEWNNGACPIDIGSSPIFIDINGSLKKFKVLKDHIHSRGNIVNLENLDDRNEAELLRGCNIWIEKNSLPDIKEEGVYYAYQLLDLRVRTVDGEDLGVIKNIFSTGSNDVYVVQKGKDELMIPAIHDVVKEIRLDDKIMIIELIEGLR